MADQKITALSELLTPGASDVLPIVDIANTATKKVTYNTMIKHPYAQVSDSTTQTIASATTAYPITYNTNDVLSGITHSTTVNPSRIQINTAGTYLVTFSAIGKSAAVNKVLEIWFAVDGVNVANSNTISRFVGTANERIITVTFIYTFSAGSYFELVMRSDDTGTTLTATGAQSNPTRPACPSIIVTVNRISS